MKTYTPGPDTMNAQERIEALQHATDMVAAYFPQTSAREYKVAAVALDLAEINAALLHALKLLVGDEWPHQSGHYARSALLEQCGEAIAKAETPSARNLLAVFTETKAAEAEYDARLIAAAPELLAALKWATDQIDDDLDPDHQAALASCRAAIAKAEGTQ